MGLESQSEALYAAFIQSPEHRPNAKHSDFTLIDQIPLIDLSPLNSTIPPDPTTLDSLVAQIHAACRDGGFFEVINHGVSPQLRHTVQSEAANFFSLPLQEKAKVRRDFENPLGYYDTELTKNVRDWKEVFDFACRGKIRLPTSFELESDEIRTVTNQWPQNPPGLRSLLIPELYLCMTRHRFPGGPILRNSLRLAPPWIFDSSQHNYLSICIEIWLLNFFIVIEWFAMACGYREACEKYAEAAEKLAFRLVELISLSLGLPADYFNSKFEEQTSVVRLNHYSPCPVPELALGVGSHKDPGALTVLAQDDVGGLQVKRKDGEWIGVKPIPNSFVINLGDCMQVWSNDKYASVEHRVVVNDKKGRFSIPFFLNPSHYVMVGPVPDLVNEKNPPKYREYCWGEFIENRRHSNFKNLGTENLQIHHFYISENSSE